MEECSTFVLLKYSREIMLINCSFNSGGQNCVRELITGSLNVHVKLYKIIAVLVVGRLKGQAGRLQVQFCHFGALCRPAAFQSLSFFYSGDNNQTKVV